MSLSAQSYSLSTLNHRHVISSVSTNSELIDQLQSGKLNADDKHLFTAETQTAGRGQRERSWQSPLGNVYLSLYHPIKLPISGLLSLVIGVELAKMPVIQQLNHHLQAQGLKSIGVKWANDLGFYPPVIPIYPSSRQQQQQQQLEEQTEFQRGNLMSHPTLESIVIPFNKLAGILIEPVWLSGKLAGVVIGVGLNVKATPELTAQTLEGMSYQAISLQDIYDSVQSADNFRQASLQPLPSLTTLYEQVAQALLTAVKGFETLIIEKSTDQTIINKKFMQEFDRRDALAGLKMRITQNQNHDEQVLRGLACGIDTNGCLQLQQDNGNISAIFTGRIDVINEA